MKVKGYASGASASSALRGGSLAAFAFALAFAFGGGLWSPADSPPYFDFDASTEAIFVNNLSYQERYDHYFAAPPDDEWKRQNDYRATYAAQRLPLSIPLSWVQRAFSVPPHEVDWMVRRLSGALAIATALAIGFALLRERSAACFLAGALCVHPALFLVTRNGVIFWILVLLLFWLAIGLLLAWCRRPRAALLYALALVMAAVAMNPYPPVLVLPPVLLSIAAIHGRLGRAFRDRHVWGAAALALALFAAGTASIGWVYEGSVSEYWSRLQEFREYRSDAFDVRAHLETPLGEKLAKLVNQQVLFGRDELGDPTRADDPWTLGVRHWPSLAMLALAVLGAIDGLRRHDRTALSVAAVLGWVYACFLTVSYPEGRYVLVALPCWIYFCSDLLSQRIANAELRRFAMAVLLLASGISTYRATAGEYSDEVERNLAAFDGLREVAAEIARTPGEGDRHIHLSVRRNYPTLLYFGMLSNFQTRWPVESRFEAMAAEPRPDATLELFVVIDEKRPRQWQYWRQQGFADRGRVVTHPAGRQLRILRLVRTATSEAPRANGA